MFLRYFTRTFAKKRIGCSARFIRGCSSEIATHNLDPSSVQAQMEAREGKAVTNLPFAKDLFLGKFDPVRNPYQASNVVLGLICRSACKPILQEFVWCVFCDLLFIPSRTCQCFLKFSALRTLTILICLQDLWKNTSLNVSNNWRSFQDMFSLSYISLCILVSRSQHTQLLFLKLILFFLLNFSGLKVY